MLSESRYAKIGSRIASVLACLCWRSSRAPGAMTMTVTAAAPPGPFG